MANAVSNAGVVDPLLTRKNSYLMVIGMFFWGVMNRARKHGTPIIRKVRRRIKGGGRRHLSISDTHIKSAK